MDISLIPKNNETLEQFKLRCYKIFIKRIKYHLNCILAKRAVANYPTLGFLDECEDYWEKKLGLYKTRVRMYELNKKTTTRLTNTIDVAKAKMVPISTFIKVPNSKKVLCLFHADKTPSMHIYGTTYHCFSCGAHGTTIDVIMKLCGLTFVEAVRKLS